jgi:hypothetical protein
LRGAVSGGHLHARRHGPRVVRPGDRTGW